MEISKKMEIVKKISLLLFAGFLFASCGSGSEKNKIDSNHDSDWETSGSNKSLSSNAIMIKKANGEVLGSIVAEGSYSFTYNGHTYISAFKGDKRKYKGDDSQTIEVKYKEEGFKVRSSDGKLLWKVKITSDKIKISDNEEGQNPWEIKVSENDKVKIKKDDKEIGTVKFEPSKNEMDVSSDSKGFVVNTDKLSLAYAVLLIDDISDRDKFVIMTEILARRK